MSLNRREFLGSMAATAVALRPQATAVQGKVPNILHLQVDQMQWWAIANRSLCRTPNINRLAAEGINFERSYTACALCCPSRAILATGAFHWHNGVFNQVHSAQTVHRDMYPDVITYSARLREVGYRQGYVGKWDVSWLRTPLDFGYDEIAAPMAYNSRLLKGIDTNPDRVPHPRPGALQQHADRWFSWPGSKPFVMWGHQDGPEEETRPYWVAENGIRMMKRFAATGRPWQLQIQWLVPHDPYIPSKKYLDRYDAAKIPVPKSFYDNFEGKPELNKRESETWGKVTEDDYREGRAHYYAFCEEVDAQIGRVLEALRETGQEENTLVAFTADHGDMAGNHRMWIKGWQPYEETYRVPLVVRWPARIKPGLKSSRLVHVHDLAYTYVDAAGAAPLGYEEGRSLLPLADNPERRDWPDQILCAYYGCEFLYTQRIVITDRYKYVFNGYAFDELYDLKNDPEEMHNRVNDPAYAAITDDMRARLYELMAQMGDPFGDPSPHFDMPDTSLPNRYGAPRYLPRGKRMVG